MQATDMPQVPAILIEHEEPPISDYVNHRLVRAMTATLDRLEPKWGRFEGRVYTIDNTEVSRLPDRLMATMPTGWSRLDLSDFSPPDGEVHVFANEDKLFAALVVDPGEGDITPVMILRNDALVASDK